VPQPSGCKLSKIWRDFEIPRYLRGRRLSRGTFSKSKKAREQSRKVSKAIPQHVLENAHAGLDLSADFPIGLVPRKTGSHPPRTRTIIRPEWKLIRIAQVRPRLSRDVTAPNRLRGDGENVI
jgi:hypothetical protein